MSRFRFLVAWLLLAALPLQGLAAASMLFCGMGAQHGAGHLAQPVAHSDPAGHDHASHGHGQPLAAEPQQQAQQATHIESQSQSQAQLPDASHECGVCASCGNGVGMVASPRPLAVAALAPAELDEPFVRIHPRPATVPDKPPRA